MILLNPKQSKLNHLDDQSRELLQKTISFFENKGKQKIKEDDHERTWYGDFLEFSKKEKLFATFLTHKKYGKDAARWDTSRPCQLSEILGFYGRNYWYVWQVMNLGLVKNNAKLLAILSACLRISESYFRLKYARAILSLSLVFHVSLV